MFHPYPFAQGRTGHAPAAAVEEDHSLTSSRHPCPDSYLYIALMAPHVVDSTGD